MSTLNCKTCKLAIKSRQHKLVCVTCNQKYHRICLPKISNSKFYEIRENWNCNRCEILKRVNQVQRRYCDTCQSPLYKDNICFKCHFPSQDIHIIPKDVELDPITSINFLFNEENQPNFLKGQKIAYLNVNSLRNKIHELSGFLSKFQFDVFACAETKLNNQIQNCMISIPNYELLRYDRENKLGGGTVIYIHNRCKFHSVKIDVEFPEFVEVYAIKIHPPFKKPFVFVSVYKPPNTNDEQFLSSFECLLFHLNQTESPYFILGDFNIDLSSKSNSSKQCKTLTKRFSLKQLIKSPTRTTETSSTLIDHLYAKKDAQLVQAGNFTLTNSDHNCIFAILNKNVPKTIPKIISSRNLKTADWCTINNEFSKVKTENIFKNPVDSLLPIFETHVIDFINEKFPISKKRIKNRGNNWLSNELLQLFHKRNVKLSQAKNCKKPEYFKEFRKLRNEANVEIKNAKQKYFLSKFSNLSDSNAIWRAYDELIGKKNENISIQFLSISNSLESDPTKLANALASAFVVNSKNPSEALTMKKSQVFNEANDTVITQTDVQNACKQLKKKSNQLNEIPYDFLKNVIANLAKPLSKIFNSLFEEGTFPDYLKHAIVTPIYKGKGSRYDANSYRPISTLPLLSKLFEKILHNKMTCHIETNSLLNDRQFGFRKNRSCQSALSVFTADIHSAISKKSSKLGALYLDMKKGFDYIPYKELINVLENDFNFKGKLLKIMCSYLTNRSFSVRINEFMSTPFPLNAGCRQGSVLGSLLFNCYYNNVIKTLDGVDYCLFADDLVFYSKGQNEIEIRDKLQNVFYNVVDWCEKNKLCVNFEKCKFMVFHKSQVKTDPTVIFSYNDTVIERVVTFKYLGLYLDECMTFQDHYNHITSKIASAIGCLNNIKKFLNETVFTILLNSFVLTIIDYGLPIWGHISKDKIEKLQGKIDVLIKTFFYPQLSKLYTRQFWSKNNSKCSNLIKLNNKIERNSMLEKCNVLSIQERYQFYLALFTYKHVKLQLGVNSVNQLFQYQTRNGEIVISKRLNVPFYESNVGQNSITFRAASLWNKLPSEIRETERKSILSVKKLLNEWCMASRSDDFTIS